jgi:acetyl-CoA acetyltransferase family protein
MGETAENVARKYNVSRSEQEQFAFESQQKAAHARETGRLVDEIVPVMLGDGSLVTEDSCLRPQTTLQGLADLKLAFRADGTVTAGTASPLTDGAVAVLVTSAEFAARNGLKVLARVRSTAVAGVEPEFMGMGPVPATLKALKRAGLTIDDIDVFELNEAFSSQAIACMRELNIDRSKVNIDGGAIALGHPLGATGARITAKAAQIMQRESWPWQLNVSEEAKGSPRFWRQSDQLETLPRGSLDFKRIPYPDEVRASGDICCGRCRRPRALDTRNQQNRSYPCLSPALISRPGKHLNTVSQSERSSTKR